MSWDCDLRLTRVPGKNPHRPAKKLDAISGRVVHRRPRKAPRPTGSASFGRAKETPCWGSLWAIALHRVRVGTARPPDRRGLAGYWYPLDRNMHVDEQESNDRDGRHARNPAP